MGEPTPDDARRAPEQPRRWPTGLLLFLAFQGLFLLTASGRVSRGADEFEVYLQVESLWERQELAISQCPDALFFGRVGVDGKKYAPYGPGTAFLAIGHHALGRGLAAALGIERARDPVAWNELVAAVTSLASTTWAALAVLATFRAARALAARPAGGSEERASATGRADERRALLVAALLGCGTSLWVYAGLFYSEPMTAAVLMAGVAWQLEGRRALAGLAVLVLVLLKSTNVILAPALAVLAAWPRDGWSLAVHDATTLAPGDPRELPPARRALLATRRALIVGVACARRAAPVLLGATAAGLALLEWNRWRFGDPFELGYSWGEHLQPGGPPRPFMLSGLPRGLFGLLVSPGKSLLLFSPPVVLGLAWARHLARAAPGAGAAVAAAAAATLLVYGSFCLWEGGYSYGPRYLVPLVPLLLLPLAVGPAPTRRALAVTMALALPIQALGITVSFLEDQALGSSPTERNERYYELRHDVPPGRPQNVYVLSYSPFVRYPGILLGHLRGEGPDEIGRGLELLPLHLGRVRRHGGAAIPPWAPLLPGALGLALLAMAGWRLRAWFRPATESAEIVS